ncbi:Ternary complex factor MIP1, partial [Musa troglodytarum]
MCVLAFERLYRLPYIIRNDAYVLFAFNLAGCFGASPPQPCRSAEQHQVHLLQAVKKNASHCHITLLDNCSSSSKRISESYQRNREVELETLPGSIHHAKPVIGESTGDSEIRNKPLPEASVRSSLKYEILQLEKQLQDEMMVRCALEKAMGFGSSAVCSSNERSVPKPTKELIREIAVLELEVMHLEQLILHRLEIVDPRKLKIDEKLAFWINIHNAIIMHAYIKYGIPEGNAKKTSLSIKAMCTIGGRSINAAMIQTYILGCRTHCTGKWLRTLLYPRLKHKARVAWQSYAIEQPEPLLHFALCSGSHSDPALESAKEDYIRATVGIWKEQKILLPKLVDSYAKDTKLSSQRLVDMVQCYLPETLRKAMQRCQNGRSKKTIEENLKQASKQTNTDMMDDGEWEAVRPLIAAQVFRKERAKSRVMEGEEIGLVLARASELRSKISNCIGGSGGGGCRQRGGDGDAGGGAATDEEEEEEEEEDEADSLVGIRDALDSLERQLAALQELQHQQSRMILLSKLKEYKGEELEAIHEVATFAGEAIELDDNLVLPPYPTHLPDLFVLDDIAAGSHFKKNKTTHNGPVAAAKQEGMGTACGTDKNQDDKTSKRFRNIIGLVVKSAIAIVSMMSMVSFAGHQPMLKSRPPTERQISSQCPQGKVL